MFYITLEKYEKLKITPSHTWQPNWMFVQKPIQG